MNKLLKLAVISLLGFNGCTMHDEIREESNHLKQTFNSLCVENNEIGREEQVYQYETQCGGSRSIVLYSIVLPFSFYIQTYIDSNQLNFLFFLYFHPVFWRKNSI